MKKIDLTEAGSGQKLQVAEIQGGKGMKAKLDALGIRHGVVITKISAQIMNGPVIVEVGKTRVAIGFGMARRIMVRSLAEVS